MYETDKKYRAVAKVRILATLLEGMATFRKKH